jgi:hypothetical protein
MPVTAPLPFPTVEIGRGCRVSRLMVGSNPLSGFSHLSPERDLEMLDYYTSGNILKLFRRCEELGLVSAQLRGDRFIWRMWREHRTAGGKLAWVAQTASELADQKAHLKSLAAWGASAVYLHGTWVDNLWFEGRRTEVEDLLKAARDTGLAAGLGTHRPDVVAHAEERGWDLDFYMTALYNLARKPKPVAAVAGLKPAEESYPDSDRELMIAAVRATRRPCLVFKVLAAGRKPAAPGGVRAALEYAYANIKPTDAVVVGVFQRDKDELGELVAAAREILKT